MGVQGIESVGHCCQHLNLSETTYGNQETYINGYNLPYHRSNDYIQITATEVKAS